MNLKQLIMAAAAAVSGLAQAITSEEIIAVLQSEIGVSDNAIQVSVSEGPQWIVDTNVVHTGSSSLKIGAVGHGQRSSKIILTSNDIICRVKFMYKVSSEGSFDKLEVYENEMCTMSASGEVSWMMKEVILLPRQSVSFSYIKDNSGQSGSDTAWIDIISIEPFVLSDANKVQVKNITCTQRYPWNGKVDIDYEVFADDPAADVWVYATGFDKDANVSMGVRAISGDGANAPVKPGKHRMTWDVTADYPGFNSTAFTVKMTALTGGAPYMVVDLSGGVDALSYPLSYLSSVPAGGWTDEYKTTKLVLRLIPPGSFMMGSPSDEPGRDGYEDLHGVVLTKPFYIGVFELTQKQWQLVMGDTPSYYKGDARPVEKVSYNTIRGSVNGAAWPTHNQVDANSFMGRLRSKVNMLFDLPTEAQWEYACRAGTATGLNNGKEYSWSGNNCYEVARWNRNSHNSGSDYVYDGKGGYTYHTKVGLYLENMWGLYDMHGNVSELCRDFWNNGLGTAGVVDPVGASKGYSNGDERAFRGGNYSSNNIRSAFRYYSYMRSGSTSEGVGFRVVCLPAE